LLDAEREVQERPNTFKKPMFEEKAPLDLGSFGKGRKRTQEQRQIDDNENKENIKLDDADKTKETDVNELSLNGDDKIQAEQTHKRQKTEES